MNEPAIALRISGISKYFESTRTQANDDVTLDVFEGEVLALCGENGAGKSTLMNMVFGSLAPDSGTIHAGRDQVLITSTADAFSQMGMVHQHFELVPSFTVAQNVLLGAELGTRGFVDDEAMNQFTAELSKEFGLPVEPRATAGSLPIGVQQRVEILKALRSRARILILDEPTAVLTPREASELMDVVQTLARSGRTIILITHKLDEVMHAADRVAVMRQGRLVGLDNAADTSIDEIARLMVGRDIAPLPPSASDPGDIVMSVKGLKVGLPGEVLDVDDVHFDIAARSILGLAGVTGNGQTEMVEALTGLRRAVAGTVAVNGDNLSKASVRRRRESIGHVPEDRLGMGLDLQANIEDNIAATQAPKYASRFGWLDRDRIRSAATRVIEGFRVASGQPTTPVGYLSGGNMQKVILGRELGGDPAVLIANQPTRGLDVGSIDYVHHALIEARDAGMAILLVSAEIDEVLALSDQVAVMSRGKLIGPFPRDTIDAEQIGRLMAGGTPSHSGTVGTTDLLTGGQTL